MTDNINPSHYKGPFECIELSRLLSSDWGHASGADKELEQ